MEKTVNMIIEETKQNLADVINQSGLPISVIDLIVTGLYNEVHSLTINTYKQEQQAYNTSVQEETERME